MDLITVIIPVYKAEKTIEACLKSICNQTYKNLEILVINDGSPDKSAEICENLSIKDNRIKVIHKKNGGVSSARNLGLDKSRGKYIGFVDSDDELKSTMIEILYNDIKRNKVKVAVSGYLTLKPNGDMEKSDDSSDVQILQTSDVIKQIFTTDKINGFMWNKLFVRELFKDIRFSTDMEICEDLYVVCKIFSKDFIVSYNPKCMYFYKTNDLSATNNLKRLFFEQGLSKYNYAYKKILNIFNENDVMQSIIKASLANVSMNLLFTIKLKDELLDECVIKYLKKDIKRNIYYYIKCRDIKLTNKIKRLTMYLFPRIVKIRSEFKLKMQMLN